MGHWPDNPTEIDEFCWRSISIIDSKNRSKFEFFIKKIKSWNTEKYHIDSEKNQATDYLNCIFSLTLLYAQYVVCVSGG